MPVNSVFKFKRPSNNVQPPDRVRVVTFNLWGQRGAWTDRRSVLLAGLRELQPDLVAFQEAIKTDTYDQVRQLQENTPSL